MEPGHRGLRHGVVDDRALRGEHVLPALALLQVLGAHLEHLLEVVGHRRQLRLEGEDHARGVRLLVAALEAGAALRLRDLQVDVKGRVKFNSTVRANIRVIRLWWDFHQVNTNWRLDVILSGI